MIRRRSSPPRSNSDTSSDTVVSLNTTEPVGQLHPQPWMTATETGAVLAALTANGDEARFIGGCVRDALLRRPIRDIDIAVPMPPQRVMEKLTEAAIRVVPTGIDHGTVTAVIGRQHIEITTLRVDVETFGRRARVAFTDDWVADAARRDFTINALSCTPKGQVYDYFNGIDDLGHGRIRFVGNARDRIGEDVLRLLRFFRFYALYGRPPPNREALAACRAEAHGLALLSGERVRVEVFRTLMAPDPADVMVLMHGEKVLSHVLPEAGDPGRLRTLTWLDTRALRCPGVAPDPVRRLAALLRTDAAGAAAVAERLKLSNRYRNRLVTMATPPWPVSPEVGAIGLRRALQRMGPEAVIDVALLTWAEEMAQEPRRRPGRTAAWVTLLEAAGAWTPIAFPLKGRDALDLGVAHGRRVGRLLKATEAWWEENDYRPDRDACLDKLRTLIAEGG